MRNILSDGHPEKPLLLYVGRLGFEKRLHRLRNVLDENPNVHLAIVGHGPAEESLRECFKGYPVTFAGKMEGTFKICFQFILIHSLINIH